MIALTVSQQCICIDGVLQQRATNVYSHCPYIDCAWCQEIRCASPWLYVTLCIHNNSDFDSLLMT